MPVNGSNSSGLMVVGLASSAGGLNALKKFLNGLPADFPAAIVLVQHLSPDHPSLLAEILSHYTALKVKQVEHGDILCAGHLYVAPPGWHVLVKPGGVLALSREGLVHFVRPSADRLFQSLAASFDGDSIAVIFTGTGVDGAQGVAAVKQAGGTVIVQDPETSEFSGMPKAAIQTGLVDYVLPLEKIASFVVDLIVRGKAE